ncbi:MAG: flavin reductase family protein [Steroidobacteraceae bacterium]
MTIDRDSFRAGMRCLAASVCVITTTTEDGKRFGLTATAVCSVSADPPTLLACVNSATGTWTAIQAAQRFAVNVLSVEDVETSNRFASPIPPEERFIEGLWDTLATGAPVFKKAVVAFDCSLNQVVDASTHRILIGEIQGVRLQEKEVSPLLYAQGTYAGVASIATLKGPVPNYMTGWMSSDPRFLEDPIHWGRL